MHCMLTYNINKITIRMLTNRLKVASYNVLSKFLCSEASYSPENYDPSSLLYENRYARLWDNLEGYVADRSVICLQEVDVETSGRLHIDFKKRAYEFHYHPYGMTHNGYMGVAIAVPRIFNIKRIDRFRIMDGKEWPKVDTSSSFGTSTLKWLSGGYLDFTVNYANWFKARSKWNFMLTLEIEVEPNKSIFVSTIHMPCAFKNQSIMITSAALALEHIQKLAGHHPYVLAGDFNICPGTNLYDLITIGRCQNDEIEKDYPPEDTWRPGNLSLRPMRSALKEFSGREPEWTNFCLNSIFGNTDPFKDTLDYILMSDHLRVTNAFCRAERDELCPNNKEPSDHVLIWSELEIMN